MSRINISGENQFIIQKNDQNALKGLLWGVGGVSLVGGTLTLTAATIAGVSAAVLASMGILIQDSARNSIGASVPVLLSLSAAAILVDYLAIKVTGYCLSNSIYHLGSEYKVIEH